MAKIKVITIKDYTTIKFNSFVLNGEKRLDACVTVNAEEFIAGHWSRVDFVTESYKDKIDRVLLSTGHRVRKFVKQPMKPYMEIHVTSSNSASNSPSVVTAAKPKDLI